MSDSDDDLLSNNAFSIRNEGTTIQAKGPNNTNISSFSFRNNFLTSTMQMLPRNFERQRHRELNYDQRSLYYRRETSPMSLRSVPDLGPRNFHHPYYSGGAGYQRSVYNGRSASPTSVRSIDTTASVSATDIALAFKNANFNKHDLWLIKEAYNKFLKCRTRKRIEKRRNLRMFLKSTRRKSGDDSGEQGSDSSISSDDGRSIRTAIYKENIPSYKTTKTNLRNFRTTISESNMYKDCTENIRQNSFRNLFSIGNVNQEKTHNTTHASVEKSSFMKDRFRKGFLLPSQRFNKSAIGPLLPELSKLNNIYQNNSSSTNSKKPVIGQNKRIAKPLRQSESEEEEIFSEITTIEKNDPDINVSHKRHLNVDDSICNTKKKCKVQQGSDYQNKVVNNEQNDFIFAKPQMPVRKSGNVKKKILSPEKLIAKSSQPLIGSVEHIHTKFSAFNENKSFRQCENINNLEKEAVNDESEKTSHSNDEISMRPSFIKRKLFTQRLDVAENKNFSDSSQSNSPQIKNYTGSNKEKNKTRKLASSQSCLSRDVLGDDSNLLDLIHKIVPADQINLTNGTNKTVSHNKNSQADPDDKWDVTSVISTCNDNDLSDTFTDEDIFKIEKKSTNKPKSNTKIQSKLTPQCKIVIEKLPQNLKTQTRLSSNLTTKQNGVNGSKGVNQKHVNTCIKSFWDTDFESDLENHDTLPRNLNNSKLHNIGNTSINNNKNCRKPQNAKVKCVTASVISKPTVTIKKSQKDFDLKNTSSTVKPNKTSKTKNKSDSPESKQNESLCNLSNRSLRSTRSAKNFEEIQKPDESTVKTVTLISHRMSKPKRLAKTKTINTIESPSPKETDVSASEFNISAKSLRSRQKKNSNINEKLVTRNAKTRNRSGVKGI